MAHPGRGKSGAAVPQSRRGKRRSQRQAEHQQQNQQRRIGGGEQRKIAPALFRRFSADLLVGDQACHRCDQRAQAAQVAAHDQGGPVLGEAGQKQRRRHVADDLAGQHGDHLDAALQHRNQKLAERLHPPDVADKDKEGDKRPSSE